MRGRFTFYLTVLLLVFTGLFWVFFSQQNSAVAERLIDREIAEAGGIALQIAAASDAVISDIAVLKDDATVADFAAALSRGGELESRAERLVRLFENIMRQKSRYVRIRYIDGEGNEILGVERTREGISEIEDAHLSRISRKKYERILFDPVRDIGVSNMESHTEGGLIEIPRRPVFHVFAKVFDGPDVVGFVVATVDANHVIAPARAEGGERVLVLDDEGRLLRDTSRPSFAYSERTDPVFDMYRRASPVSGNGNRFLYTDEENFFFFEKIPLGGASGQSVILAKDLLASAAAVPGPQNARMFFIAALSTLISAVALFYISFLSPLVRRIEENLRLVRSIARGVFPKKKRVKITDEISEVTAGVYAMAEKLERAAERIRETDKRLNLRLKELADRNAVLEDTKRAMLNILEDSRILERRIKEERDRVEAIISSIDEGLLVVDTNYRVIMSNPAARSMFGVEEEGIVGVDTGTFLRITRGGENIRLSELPLAKMFAEGRAIRIDRREDMFFETDRREKFPVEMTMTPLIKKGFVAAIIVFRDVTEWKELERARSSFISTASHQLRTPIGIIRWYAELLQEGKLDKTQKDFVERIHKGAIRAIEVINLLLMIARVESGRMKVVKEEIDIRTFIGEILNDFASQFEANGIRVVFAVKDKLPKVFVDGTMLREVVTNFLTNAVRYTNAGGIVEISVGMRGADDIRVSVKDNGIGIPKDAQSKIFSRFYRAPNAEAKIAGGSGLGLALAKTLVEQWGGEIWFVSEEGKGSTFSFTVPVIKSGHDNRGRSRGA